MFQEGARQQVARDLYGSPQCHALRNSAFPKAPVPQAKWLLSYFCSTPGHRWAYYETPGALLLRAQDPGGTGALCLAPSFHFYTLPAGLGGNPGGGDH